MTQKEKTILHTFQDKTFIEVFDKGDFRFLCFRDSIVQSKILLSQPQRLVLRYTQYMMAASLLSLPNPCRVLLIGVGAGALLHFFNHYLPDTHIDAVDYSEHIIKIARGFFSLPEHKKIRVHCDDGLRFIADGDNQMKYDLILLDAFNDNGMAKNIYSNEFFRLARRRLSQGGIITCNLWSGNRKAYNRVEKAIHNNSESAVFIPVRKRENIICLLFQEAPPWNRICPAKPILKQLSSHYHINFSEISTIARKYNLKLADRVQLWFN